MNDLLRLHTGVSGIKKLLVGTMNKRHRSEDELAEARLVISAAHKKDGIKQLSVRSSRSRLSLVHPACSRPARLHVLAGVQVYQPHSEIVANRDCFSSPKKSNCKRPSHPRRSDCVAACGICLGSLFLAVFEALSG